MIQLTPQETEVIETIRRHGPHAEFVVEKRPTKNNKEGEIVSIRHTIKTDLYVKMTRDFQP